MPKLSVVTAIQWSLPTEEATSWPYGQRKLHVLLGRRGAWKNFFTRGMMVGVVSDPNIYISG